MYMAKIVGTVVATRKEESLVGYKLMVLKRMDADKNLVGHDEVAADYVGAGIGDYVLVCRGSAVRINTPKVTIDMAIVGIIDTIDV